jgi:FkbM family methyltransferase
MLNYAFSILGIRKTKKIELGGKALHLDMRFPHERAYYETILNNQKHLDQLIAERFIMQGDFILDAGANIGYSSLLFLKNGASKVYSFEPVPALFDRLKKMEGPDLKAFHIALSDDNGQAEMLLSRSHNQGHTLNPQWEKMFPSVYGDKKSICRVKKARLDDLLPDHKFDFMKVDIEGSEEAFLRGSANILRKDPPRILQIEIYQEMFDDVYRELCKYFKFIKRAIVNTKSTSLELLDINEKDRLSAPEVSKNPPTYICSNNSLLLSNDHIPKGQMQNGYFVLDEFAELIFGGACLQKVLYDFDFQSVLDIGSGSGKHSEIFKKYNKDVTSIDFGESCYYEERKKTDEKVLIGDYMEFNFDKKFDLIWASHVLEHQLNVNSFLTKIIRDLEDGGILAITVPPHKDEIVGGHLSLWNGGLLLYNLVLAGFNCKEAKLLKYGYNISIIVQKKPAALPKLDFDKGDIEKLLDYFPDGITEPFDGDLSRLNW